MNDDRNPAATATKPGSRIDLMIKQAISNGEFLAELYARLANKVDDLIGAPPPDTCANDPASAPVGKIAILESLIWQERADLDALRALIDRMGSI